MQHKFTLNGQPLEVIKVNDELEVVVQSTADETCKWYIDEGGELRENFIPILDYWENRRDYKAVVCSHGSQRLEGVPVIVEKKRTGNESFFCMDYSHSENPCVQQCSECRLMDTAQSKVNWTDGDMIDFHNFIFRHSNQYLKMGEYLEEFKSQPHTIDLTNRLTEDIIYV